MKNEKLTVEAFGTMEWKKNWAGEWSLLTCTYLGYQYTKQLKDELGDSLQTSLFISRKGYTFAYFEKAEQKRFGDYLANQLALNAGLADKWCEELKKRTDAILNLIKELSAKKIEASDYARFVQAFYAYGVPHRATKLGVDFLSADLLKDLLPKFTAARLYAEPVYTETEKFMRLYAGQLSAAAGLPAELILCATKEEFEKFIQGGSLPAKDLLEQRYELGALLFRQGEYEVICGREVQELEKMMESAILALTRLEGVTAHGGQAKGTARVILDPKQQAIFNPGDILVTGMTRPEYLPFIKKSAAFLTDAGGMLSHAAITARELQKPCVVGLELATKIIKDGDEVEIDADKGIVKIIKRAS